MHEPYDSPALKGFLESHYEGRADTGPLSGYDYELVRCTQCELAYQRNIPADRLLSEIYDVWIPPSERERLRKERTLYDYSYMADQVHFFIDQLGLRPHEIDVLDFGMGWCEWASMARAYGCRVAGAELSVERLEHARSIGIETVDWDTIPKRQFHFIHTEQVFEHLIEPVAVLKHLARALHPNGLLLVSVPDSRAALKKAAGQKFSALSPATIVPVQPLEHVNCFEFKTIERLAAKAGLKVKTPSLRKIYHSSSGWFGLKRVARLATRPIYRHLYPKSTFVFLAKA
jgi:2-polyprenyl-3-methyl-5-hydroxy-6-metoxy-1,4-benzoquinol methylase